MNVSAGIDRSLLAASRAVRKATREALRDAGNAAREELLSQATVVPGADRRFSNSKKGSLRVRVRVDRDGFVRVAPAGPWALAETGAPPHGGHPGTKAKQGRKSWSKGRDATFARVERQLPAKVGRDVEGAFRRG